MMGVPTPSPPLPHLLSLGRIALSDSEKAEALADNLETQFQPVTDPSVSAVTEVVEVALRSYEEVQEATRGLMVSKAPGPNGIPNRALKHLPQRAVSVLVRIFNAILLTNHFPTVWKHAQVISILKPGKDPALPSYYRPISLLDTIGKLFGKILLSRILHEVSERGLMQDEQFGFRHRHSTSLQVTRPVERITRNFGEKWLTVAVFLDVAKTFDTVWIDGLLYKLTLLNLPSYIVHTLSSYLRGRAFEASFQTATSSRRGMWAGVADRGVISPVILVCMSRHGRHSQADAARQLPGVIPKRPSMVVE